VSVPALRPERPKKRRKDPIVYTVEVEPAPEDPKAAAKVAAWLRKRLASETSC
jgi:hypothetical protein